MKYKVGEKVVLATNMMKKGTPLFKLNGSAVKIMEVNELGSLYKVEGGHCVYGYMINHEKTAELKQEGSLEKIVAEKNNREINNVDIDLSKMYEDKSRSDAIKPKHYQKNGIDRIELWKLQYSEQSFRDGMRMLADRYFSRYENKNGIEDLFKGIEVIERLIEWEESLND